MRLRVQSLALLSGLRIQRCLELWCRSQTWLDPALLWLWHRSVATAPIRPVAWEPPYAGAAAQEMAKRPKKQKQKKECLFKMLSEILQESWHLAQMPQ